MEKSFFSSFVNLSNSNRKVREKGKWYDKKRKRGEETKIKRERERDRQTDRQKEGKKGKKKK